MADMTYEEKETVLDGRRRAAAAQRRSRRGRNDPARNMFGFPRNARSRRSLRAGQPLIDELLNDLGRFTGAAWEQEDDITS